MGSQPIMTDVTRFVTLEAYVANRSIFGKLVTILDIAHHSRRLVLLPTYSRVLVAHSVQELVMTNEAGKKPGDVVDRVAYLGFFEVARSGCIIVGERLLANGREIGHVIGFDETHAPNHMNIVVRAKELRTGKQLGLRLGTRIDLKAAPRNSREKQP